MLYINKITNDPSQRMTLTGIPGYQIEMTLRFLPRTKRWVMGVSFGDVSIQGVAVVCSLNLLRQFKNNIPFGISCIRADGLDPYALDDFSGKLANLYLLNAADVAEIEAEWFK
jgi:hypothetical protein